jgi:hypothetical protein
MSASSHITSSIPSLRPDLEAQLPLQLEATKREVSSGLVGESQGTGADTATESSNELRSSLRKGLNLKTFVLTPEMSTFLGVFYPTGYIVVMFPNVHQAEQAAHELVKGGYDGQAIMLLPPEIILREIAPSDRDDSDLDLPSVGTEGVTAQKFVQLAREGQFGLMVHAKADKDTEIVMSVVRTLPFSYAQKYHMLAMEDLK